MDIIFDCPNCQQELVVDSAGAGTEIDCPACGETITIPRQSTKAASEVAVHAGGQPVNPIAASAAAKIEKHLKVPVHDKPSELLIKKTNAPVEVVTKGAEKRVRLHTIRHATCFESGHDRFDEKVTEFLSQVGEANLIGIHSVNYTYVDIASQKTLSDFGLLSVYRG
jgi:DNA-directed RNA polymerase subunit M/transcription elongation factor TFIIS